MKTCSVCENPYYGKGFCKKHYSRWRTHGDPTIALTNGGRQRGVPCSLCGGPVFARSLCRKHWKRWRRYGDPAMSTRASPGEHLLFCEKVSKYEGDKCVVWPYGKATAGYGAVIKRTASNLVCEMAHGPAPDDKREAAHSCGNPVCVNPRHLRWASHAENMADMVKHGRTNSRFKSSI